VHLINLLIFVPAIKQNKKTNIMTNSILNIANQVVNQMNKTSFKDIDMLNCEICSAITNENVSFDNETAYSMFKSFVIKQILVLDEKLYRTIYPLYEY
jgi:hypothetical protein